MSIDMLAHIFPLQGQMYPLIGAGSNETCRTRYTPNGYGYFDKNENWEEGWGDEHYVYRAFDISSFRHNEVYALWTKLPDGTLRYGNAWTPRYMDEGQIFKRVAWVIHYDAAGNIKKQQSVTTYLKLVKWHASKTFASGRTVQSVVELQYGFSPNVTDVREHYYYGLGHGLVGFEDGVLSTFIGQGTPTTIKPQTVIPWIDALRPPVPPKENTVPDYPPPTSGGVRRALADTPNHDYVNQRAQPNPASATSNSSADVGDLLIGDEVEIFLDAKVGDWAWCKPLNQVVRPAGRQPAVDGWVSLQGGKVVFVPPVLPPSEVTYLLAASERDVLLDYFTRIRDDADAGLKLVEGLQPSDDGGL